MDKFDFNDHHESECAQFLKSLQTDEERKQQARDDDLHAIREDVDSVKRKVDDTSEGLRKANDQLELHRYHCLQRDEENAKEAQTAKTLSIIAIGVAVVGVVVSIFK